MIPWRNPLTNEQQKHWKPLHFRSKSNAILKGLLATSLQPKPKGVIVMGHPMGKEAKGFFLKNGYTETLRKKGYHVLIFDINGFGESQIGNFNYYEDIIAAGFEAKKHYPNLPLGYLGISLGGQFATIAFAETHPYEFAIVESAANTLEDFWVQFPFAYNVLKFIYFFVPKYQKQIRMIDRIKSINGLKSLLLIYVENDALILNDAGPKFKVASAVPTRLVLFKDAKHAQLPKSKNRRAYFDLIVSYFDSHTTIPSL